MLNRNFRCKESAVFSGDMQKPGCSQAGDKYMTNEARQLLKRLRGIDFTLADTVLYLDAYPSSKGAMARYKELVGERHELLTKLAEAGFPMNFACNLSADWRWCESPWPWEYEANV